MKAFLQTLFISPCLLFISACSEHNLFEPTAPQTSLSGDSNYVPQQVLISEILADPKSDGVEFIEIYNHSDQIIDLRSLEITTVNSSGKRNRLHQVSKESVYLYPGSYKVLSKDSQILQEHYPSQVPQSFQSMETFPTLTNTQGAVLLFRNEQLVDSFSYHEKMHDAFIKNPKGVSLERVDFNTPTNIPGNFISAAANHGYATPGYQNSQALNQDTQSYGVYLINKKFAPEKEDNLELHIGFEKGGKMANVSVYSSNGISVKKLLSNHRLGTRNLVNWDGTDDQGKPVPSGVYYVYTELYSSVEQRESFKEACLLLR